MKKLFYIIMFALTSAASFTACTEEEVTPNGTEIPNGGGNVIDRDFPDRPKR
jgi:hypothetical protein